MSYFSDTDGAIYRQTDGVAMGSLVVLLLINIFLAQYEDELRSNSTIYFRYVYIFIKSLQIRLIFSTLDTTASNLLLKSQV